MMFILWIVFFFSSRRRHTSWTGDWSSDVCSSDLARARPRRRARSDRSRRRPRRRPTSRRGAPRLPAAQLVHGQFAPLDRPRLGVGDAVSERRPPERLRLDEDAAQLALLEAALGLDRREELLLVQAPFRSSIRGRARPRARPPST